MPSIVNVIVLFSTGLPVSSNALAVTTLDGVGRSSERTVLTIGAKLASTLLVITVSSLPSRSIG